MTRPARYRVLAPLDSTGAPQEGTVTLDRARGLFTVRPLRRHRVYELRIEDVAQMVCQRVLLAERRQKAKEKAERRKARRKS
jgi:hypothetical protein